MKARREAAPMLDVLGLGFVPNTLTQEDYEPRVPA